MRDKKHLTEEGITTLLLLRRRRKRIKSGMNTGRKY